MRPWIWIVIIIGAPFYLVSQAEAGTLDITTALVAIGLVVVSLGAMWKMGRDMRVAKAQRDFWLNQKK